MVIKLPRSRESTPPVAVTPPRRLPLAAALAAAARDVHVPLAVRRCRTVLALASVVLRMPRIRELVVRTQRLHNAAVHRLRRHSHRPQTARGSEPPRWWATEERRRTPWLELELELELELSIQLRTDPFSKLARESIQLTDPFSKSTERRDHCVAVFRVVVAGRYLVCRFN